MNKINHSIINFKVTSFHCRPINSSIYNVIQIQHYKNKTRQIRKQLSKFEQNWKKSDAFNQGMLSKLITVSKNKLYTITHLTLTIIGGALKCREVISGTSRWIISPTTSSLRSLSTPTIDVCRDTMFAATLSNKISALFLSLFSASRKRQML